MENPFESGHIKNYILFYISVVVIMVLFFIASTLFNDVKDIDKKIFNTEVKSEVSSVENITVDEEEKSKFRLLEVNAASYSGYDKGTKVK